MYDDYPCLWNRYVGVAGIIAIIIVAGLVFYYDIPGDIERNQQAREDARTIIELQTLNYTGILDTLTYQYGYWGSIDSTKVAFLDGVEYTFGSQVIAQIGKNYTVTIEMTIYKDNHNSTKPILIIGSP